jgi:ABC-type antimicrobial peptide transport system permease subunit
MALGADRFMIARPLIGQAAIQCIPAIALGVAIAAWMSHLAATFLFDPRLAKPGVCIASCAFLLAVLLACVVAALVRIYRLDPAEALRTL